MALTILRNEISSVPVIHLPEDGSCPQLLHIACLAGILKRMFSQLIQNFKEICFLILSLRLFSSSLFLTPSCFPRKILDICRNFRHCLQYLPLLQQPIGNLPVGTWTREVGWANNRTLLTLHASSSLSSALNLLIKGIYLFYVLHAECISNLK